MKTNFTSILRPSLRVRMLIWSATILTLLCVAAHFALPLATARVSTRRAQIDGAVAPGAPIHPASVSVINFKELAMRDAKASERADDAPQVLQAIHPPMTIKEPDSPEQQQPTESTPMVPNGPLAVSPSPSQSFLAQEDAPKVGTGNFTIPPDTMGAVGPDKIF